MCVLSIYILYVSGIVYGLKDEKNGILIVLQRIHQIMLEVSDNQNLYQEGVVFFCVFSFNATFS